ncbi:hypothetical protein ARC78_13020 [Stenotrophomonas pictorum JCM 9942]|uniref:FecR protein domain-containing protein n=2 Tax=Stenotrophomonas pictorum TaxID=86184 RepID=A0A0R0A4L9_9GAMM|nr:FecR domain-containing protein [Stenotrophomonas pictorum]KRG40112.1 hypothetical protein ARC78_13020 [Stenotrophomonas pictorum JCM 9942]
MNIYRTSPEQTRERAAREAAEWLQVMRGGPTAAERADFSRWVAASPLHLEELLMAELVERELAASGALEAFDLDQVVAQAQAMDNVVPLRAEQPALATTPVSSPLPPSRHPRRRRWGMALAASVVLCAAAGIGWRLAAPAAPAQEYASAIGEQRTLVLADGSTVLLAPASHIAVQFSEGVRDIELREGEATFDVAHDTARPFRVHAGNNTVQAVGTRFTVNRLPSGTRVAVTEGKVKVTASKTGWLQSLLDEPPATIIDKDSVALESLGRPAALAAGEQARIPQGQQALLRMPLEVPSAAPGSLRRLNFRNDTLADIVAEFNRYNPRQIVVEDEQARQQRYSGVFNADDAESFLQFLECCSALRVSREPNRSVVTPLAEGTSRQ